MKSQAWSDCDDWEEDKSQSLFQQTLKICVIIMLRGM